jgi:hypothetical protein
MNLFGLRFRPIRAAREVSNSIGQTIHQIRPKKIAEMIITGHQYDQTIRFARFVLRRILAKAMSSVFAAKPSTISNTNTTSVITCNTSGNHQKRNKRFIGCCFYIITTDSSNTIFEKIFKDHWLLVFM